MFFWQNSSVTGITNHEEYSLVRDLPDAEKESTLTLKRNKSIAKDQKKLDEMKKKLHTDDECKLHLLLLIFTVRSISSDMSNIIQFGESQIYLIPQTNGTHL